MGIKLKKTFGYMVGSILIMIRELDLLGKSFIQIMHLHDLRMWGNREV
jgi:hypothetical protein